MLVAAFFAGIGIIHQNAAFQNFTTGFQGIPNSSPAQFMAGYLSMAAVALIMWLLQKFQGKKTEPGEPGYANDHGYLPPIKEKGVDNLFKTWWDPATEKNDPDETTKFGDEAFEEEDLEGINKQPKKGKRLAGAESMGVGVPVLTPARAFRDPVVPDEPIAEGEEKVEEP